MIIHTAVIMVITIITITIKIKMTFTRRTKLPARLRYNGQESGWAHHDVGIEANPEDRAQEGDDKPFEIV